MLDNLRAEAGEDLAADDLVETARRTRALGGNLKTVSASGDVLRDTYASYVRALSLLTAASLFEQGLARLGPIANEARAGLDSLMHDINAAFATQREGALAAIALWENRLGELQQRVGDLDRAQRADFEAWQGRYDSLLRAHLDLEGVSVPRPQLFDPANPGESYDRVSEAMRRIATDIFAALLRDCRATEGVLASIAHSGGLAELPDGKRDGAIAAAEGCDAALQAVRRQAAAMSQKASTNSDNLFTQPGESFEQFCIELGNVQRHARQMVALLRQVENALAEARLTAPEQALLDVIHSLATGEDRRVDLGLLLLSSGQPIEALMPLLGALYKRRKVYITLDPLAYPQSDPSAVDNPMT